jgi:hypothetical protein
MHDSLCAEYQQMVSSMPFSKALHTDQASCLPQLVYTVANLDPFSQTLDLLFSRFVNAVPPRLTPRWFDVDWHDEG